MEPNKGSVTLLITKSNKKSTTKTLPISSGDAEDQFHLIGRNLSPHRFRQPTTSSSSETISYQPVTVNYGETRSI